MSFPSTAQAVPSLPNDGLSFQGLALGPGTPYQIKQLEGLMKVDVRSGNTDRPRTRGAFPGMNLLKARTITATIDVGPFSGPVAQVTNLVPDPSFEYDTVGNAPASCWRAGIVSGAWAASGSRSLTVSTTNAFLTGLATNGANAVAAVAGQSYSVSAAMNITANGANGCRCDVYFRNSSGTPIGSQAATQTFTGTGLFSFSASNLIAPANTAYITVEWTSALGVGNAVTLYVDTILIAVSATLPAYIDGDTLGYEWTGTKGNSTSIPIPGWGTFGPYGNTLAGALGALRSALSTEGTTEYPLYLQLPNLPLVASMCRVLKTDAKYDITADLGSLLQDVPIQFEATDPYFYSAPTLNPQVSLPGPSGGFGFPLSFNLSFGGSSNPNQVTVTNSGDVTCWPILQITGPCLNPSVSNQSLAGNPTLSLGIQLNAGDQVYVDCDWGSIVYFPSGQSVGAPYPQILQPGSTFFGLQPTTNLLSFNSQDVSSVAGKLNVANASAYSGLL